MRTVNVVKAGHPTVELNRHLPPLLRRRPRRILRREVERIVPGDEPQPVERRVRPGHDLRAAPRRWRVECQHGLLAVRRVVGGWRLERRGLDAL